MHLVILMRLSLRMGQLVNEFIDGAGLDASCPANVHDAQRGALGKQGVDGGPAHSKSLGDFGDSQQRSGRSGIVGVVCGFT